MTDPLNRPLRTPASPVDLVSMATILIALSASHAEQVWCVMRQPLQMNLWAILVIITVIA